MIENVSDVPVSIMTNSSANRGEAIAETTGVVNFYSVGDKFGEFSNFAPYPFALDGERWPTSEHYFQAQKFEDKAYKTKIRKSNSPMLAARMGRDRKQKLRRDWESVKVGVWSRCKDGLARWGFDELFFGIVEAYPLFNFRIDRIVNN